MAPSTASRKPAQVLSATRSRRKVKAPTATSSGSNAVIMPAWVALVCCSARASKMKYRQGSQAARASR